jgi:hypothetical protein
MVSNFEFADNVVGIMVSKAVDKKLVEEVQAMIKAKLEVHEKLNLFFEIESGTHISFKAFVDQVKFNVDYAGRFEKIAVVTNLTWMHTGLAMKDLIMAANIKSFKPGERLEALAWIAE